MSNRRIDPEVEQQVIRLRKEGRTLTECARMCNISEATAVNVMKRNNMTGIRNVSEEGRKRLGGGPRMKSVKEVVDTYDELVIEAGAGGGYIVTIEETTGDERSTIPGAILAAEKKRKDGETNGT